MKRYRAFECHGRQVEQRNHRWYYVGGDGLGEPYECENEKDIEMVWVVPETDARGAVDRLRETNEALRVYLDHKERGLDVRPGWLEEEVAANDALLGGQ